MVAIRAVVNGDGERPVGPQPIQIAKVENLEFQEEPQGEPQPQVEYIIPSFVGDSKAVMVGSNEKEQTPCYEVNLTIRVQSQDYSYVMSKVVGHNVGLKFIKLGDTGQ
jgi:hypothetical protein